MEVGEDYERLVKWFLMPTLTDGMYSGHNDDQEGSNPKATNEGLPEVDWNFLVYVDGFSHTYMSKPRTFSIN